MKHIHFVWAICALLLFSSCYTVRPAGHSGKVPPGQMKKATGAKSARQYAPGHNKY
ncbi:hypothetical protein [Chitinophaga sp.]|uniref:hypothetical protein n=1 Tax=Chitinophaga sp. TaxID=1869181 RepID=UPI0031E2F26F